MEEILLNEEGVNQFSEKLESLKNSSLSNANSLSKSYSDYVGDGWHDNPVYEEAMRKSRMIDDNIQKMLDEQKNIKVVDDDYGEKLVNINDTIKIEFIYSKDDKEIEKIRLTGKYIPNEGEVTLNSPLGKTIYKKEIGKSYDYIVNDNKIKINIISRI